MPISKNKIIVGILSFAVVGLGLLLLRENEGRVSAETKLNDLKYRLETTSTENENVVLDLKGNIHDLEVKIAEMTDKHAAELNEKDGQIADLKRGMEEGAVKYDQTVKEKDLEISDVKSGAQADSERLNQVIKDKSVKIGDLGGELEKASSRYSLLLKEKEALEAKTISYEADISSLKNDLKKANRDNERLSASLEAQIEAKKLEQVHD